MRSVWIAAALVAMNVEASPQPKTGHAIYSGEMLFKLEETRIKIRPIGNGDRVVSFLLMSRRQDDNTKVIVNSIVANCGVPRYFQIADSTFADAVTKETGTVQDLVMAAPQLMDTQTPQWKYTDMICSGQVKPKSAAKKKKPSMPRADKSPACPADPSLSPSANSVEAILATVKDLKGAIAGCESDLDSLISSGRVTRP